MVLRFLSRQKATSGFPFRLHARQMNTRPESVVPEILALRVHRGLTRVGNQTPVPSNAMVHVLLLFLQIHLDTEKHAFRFQTDAGRQVPALFYAMAFVTPCRPQTQVVRVVEAVVGGCRPILAHRALLRQTRVA